jgi:Tfp pilus assembly pilus retraction ATPase PilT
MITLDRFLVSLVKQGTISLENALAYAKDPKSFQTLLR